jgi:hypothetical protein
MKRPSTLWQRTRRDEPRLPVSDSTRQTLPGGSEGCTLASVVAQ